SFVSSKSPYCFWGTRCYCCLKTRPADSNVGYLCDDRFGSNRLMQGCLKFFSVVSKFWYSVVKFRQVVMPISRLLVFTYDLIFLVVSEGILIVVEFHIIF